MGSAHDQARRQRKRSRVLADAFRLDPVCGEGMARLVRSKERYEAISTGSLVTWICCGSLSREMWHLL